MPGIRASPKGSFIYSGHVDLPCRLPDPVDQFMAMRSEDLKRVFLRYQDLLATHRETINGLNVYPVPDGDTGSNMLATVRWVNSRIEDADDMAAVCAGIAEGSLRGATGNSGLILSLILRGLAAPLSVVTSVGTKEMAVGLSEGATQAYAQVGAPLEGTILTVVREAAEEATEAAGNGTVWIEFLERVYLRSLDALDRTPDMLPVLRQAGVVDAGGVGIVLLLAAFVTEQSGTEVSLPDHILKMSADLGSLESGERPDVADLRYEVMFFLDADDEEIVGFRTAWADIGDSIVVVGGKGEWNCHIHTDHIGEAIEAAIAVGRPRSIKVTDLAEQAGSHADDRAVAFEARIEAAVAPVGVVAVAAGAGMIEIFQSLLVQGVVVGGQTMNPSTDDLLRAVDGVPAAKVIVLPNNKNIVPVAEQLDGLTTKDVVVVPTRSIPQGVAAMMGYSTGEESLDAAAETMSAAASSIISAEITRAVRNARMEDLGQIAQGDWLGIVDGRPIVSDPDLWSTTSMLIRRIMTAPIELVTIFTGSESDRAVTDTMASWIEQEYPGTDVVVVGGGQPLYPYLLSFE